jgi:HPt (histidine-containing phosphotransfer) domain-containing protein
MALTQAQGGESIYSTFRDDPELGELVEMFVAEMPNRIAELQAAIASGERELARRLAHQLKGAAGSYGFGQVTPFAASLENSLANDHPQEAILGNLQALVDLCACIR